MTNVKKKINSEVIIIFKNRINEINMKSVKNKRII